jgi:hypothetical protein
VLKFIKAEGYSKAAKNLYGQFSDKIAKGEISDIINVSKPIETCDSSTYLENIGKYCQCDVVKLWTPTPTIERLTKLRMLWTQ